MHHIGTYSHTNSLVSILFMCLYYLSNFLWHQWEVGWVSISRMSVVGPEYLKAIHKGTKAHKRHQLSVSLHNHDWFFLFSSRFICLMTKDRHGANEREQDSFYTFQQIYGWSCQSGNTSPTTGLSLSLSLSFSIHIHTQTQ